MLVAIPRIVESISEFPNTAKGVFCVRNKESVVE